MSNEPTPNPWTRSTDPAANARPAPDMPQTIQQPASPTHTHASNGDWPQQAGPAQGSAPIGNWPPANTQADPTAQPAAFGHPNSPVNGKSGGRGKIAGIVALAVLAGGAGGGAAGFAAATGLVPAGSQATQTQVVQADASKPNWTTVAAAASKAVVAIQVTSGNSEAQGSGVVIDAQGHIVTNNHVVAGSAIRSTITVLLGNTFYDATVVGTDPTTDLAVIQLVDPPSDLSVMPYADSGKLAVGDPVMAIGNPLGLDDTVTVGIISALNRPVTTQAVDTSPVARQNSNNMVVTAAIQTNAAINPGNSGGALVNTSGELVGITSSIASLSSGNTESGSIGIGFAIPSGQVKYVVNQLIATGTAQHPQIGVSATDVAATGPRGAQISNVVEGSPAASAGVQVGDLITAVDGVPVASTESLVALVRSGEVGKPMQLTVLRGQSTLTLTVTPVAAAR